MPNNLREYFLSWKKKVTQSEEIALKAFCKIMAPLLYKFINSEAELNP